MILSTHHCICTAFGVLGGQFCDLNYKLLNNDPGKPLWLPSSLSKIFLKLDRTCPKLPQTFLKFSEHSTQLFHCILGPEGILPSPNLHGGARRPRQGSKHRSIEQITMSNNFFEVCFESIKLKDFTQLVI